MFVAAVSNGFLTVALFVLSRIEQDVARVFVAGASESAQCAAGVTAAFVVVLFDVACTVARACNGACFGFALVVLRDAVLCCVHGVVARVAVDVVDAALLLVPLLVPLLVTGGGTWATLPLNPFVPLLPACMAWFR